MIASAFLMSISALCAKLLYIIPSFELLFFRSFIILILFYYYKKLIDPNLIIKEIRNKQIVLIESLLGFLFAYCYIFGIKR